MTQGDTGLPLSPRGWWPHAGWLGLPAAPFSSWVRPCVCHQGDSEGLSLGAERASCFVTGSVRDTGLPVGRLGPAWLQPALPGWGLGRSRLSPSGLGLLSEPCWHPEALLAAWLCDGPLGPRPLQVRLALLPDWAASAQCLWDSELTSSPRRRGASRASAPEGAAAPDPGPLFSGRSGRKRGYGCWDPWLFCAKVLGSVFQTFIAGAQPSAASKRRPRERERTYLDHEWAGSRCQTDLHPAHSRQWGAVRPYVGALIAEWPYLGPLDQVNCILQGPQRKPVTPQRKGVQ